MNRHDAEKQDTQLVWSLMHQDPGSTGWLSVVNRTYLQPDGSTATWDLIDGPDCVSVVALTEDRHVIVARQFRAGPGVVLNELPGGFVDDGETPGQAIERELLEETGFAGNLRLVGTSWSSARHLYREWTFVAERCRRVADPKLESGEFVATRLLTVAQFLDVLRSGQITCLGSAFWAADRLGLLCEL